MTGLIVLSLIFIISIKTHLKFDRRHKTEAIGAPGIGGYHKCHPKRKTIVEVRVRLEIQSQS